MVNRTRIARACGEQGEKRLPHLRSHQLAEKADTEGLSSDDRTLFRLTPCAQAWTSRCRRTTRSDKPETELVHSAEWWTFHASDLLDVLDAERIPVQDKIPDVHAGSRRASQHVCTAAATAMKLETAGNSEVWDEIIDRHSWPLPKASPCSSRRCHVRHAPWRCGRSRIPEGWQGGEVGIKGRWRLASADTTKA